MDAARTRVNLLDTWVDRVDMAEAARRINDFVRLRLPQQIVTVNLDFLRISVHDASFQELINTADLAIADGMPLVWASRLLGNPVPERVAGVDLILECARLAADHNYRVFLLGAGSGVADKAASVLCDRCPGLQIVGTYAPASLDQDEERIMVERIREAKPDILFVAFGAPRQDEWIRQHMAALGVPVCMGVGGALDMLSGRVSRAPAWMQGTGLEWFYRFVQEPGRLWKRYFVHDLPIFLRLLIWSSLGGPSRRTLITSIEEAVGETGRMPTIAGGEPQVSTMRV